MNDKSIEIMKKIIEDKKKKSSEQSGNQRARKEIGQQIKGNGHNKKTGGVFDK